MEENSQKSSTDIKADSPPKGDLVVNQSQEIFKPSTSKQYKKPLVVMGVLLGFLLFGFGGYVLGTWKNNQTGTIINTGLPIQDTTSPVQQSPTAVPVEDSTSDPLKPNLVSMTDWKTVSFPQNVIIGQGGESRPAKVAFEIPPNWSAEAIKAKTDEQIGGVVCKDFQVTSQDGKLVLVIKPDCGGSSPDYISPDESVPVVKLTTKKGNDGHDSYAVRYSSGKSYKYGEIGVSPGEEIDLSKDKIYPHLILQYEPDRIEQWLFTSIDLAYSGTTSNKQIALSTSDTIVSTIRLTD